MANRTQKNDSPAFDAFDAFHELVTRSTDDIRESIRTSQASEPDRRLARQVVQLLGRKRGNLTADHLAAMRKVTARITEELDSEKPDEELLAMLGHVHAPTEDPQANEADTGLAEEDGAE